MGIPEKILISIALLAMPALAVTVRSKTDLHLWQTVHDRSAPLEWSWEEGAESATLTFSNRVTHAAASVTVARAEGVARGSSPQRLVDETEETIVDVTLVQNGASVPEAKAALAYVPGAGGGPITVRTKVTPEWKRVRKPIVHVPRDYGAAAGYLIAWIRDIGTVIRIR